MAQHLRASRARANHQHVAAEDRGRDDVEQFYIEDQVGIGWNHAVTSAAWAVSHVRGNDQGAFATDFHPRHALIPALNHAMFAKGKTERATAYGTIKSLAMLQNFQQER